MHLHFELLALVQIAVRDYLDDDQRQREGKVILSRHHPSHFGVVYFEFLLANFVVFLR
jgi:hypothetical protein